MVELQAQGKSPAPFFIAHTEALSDRVSEALKELTRRDAEAEVKNQQREAVRGALRLSDVLRPLPQRMNPEAREHLRQLEQFFGGLKKSL